MGLDRIMRCNQFNPTSFGPVLLAAVLAATISGCARVHNIETGSVPDDYRTRHPIIVSEQEYAVDIAVARQDRHLTLGSADAVRGFASNYRETASGTVQIMTPVGSPNSAAAAIVAKQVRSVMIEENVPADRIYITSYQAEAAYDAAPIRLSFVGIQASTNQCGKWPADLVYNTTENKNWENFGCATQNNLAAQISDPSDLLAPRGMTPIDAQRRDKVFENYRKYGATAAAPDE